MFLYSLYGFIFLPRGVQGTCEVRNLFFAISLLFKINIFVNSLVAFWKAV